MTAFFDRQGTLVLLLVILLGLCYFVAYAFNHQPSTTPAEVVTTYLTALKNGDIKAAYALLSEEDKKYFDVDRFRIFLYRQPQLQLLYGGGELNRAQLLRTYMSFVQVQTKDQATQQDNEVIMKVTLPDISKILGSELLQYYLFGEEHQFLTVEQNLALSKRLEARLRTLRNAPTQSGYHKFTLVKHNRNWQLSAPEWRVEAPGIYELKLTTPKRLH